MSKTDKVKNKRLNNGHAVTFFFAGVLLLVALMLYSPGTGFFRTLPFISVAGAVVCFSKMPVKYTGVFSFVLTLCIYIFAGVNILASLFFAAICTLLFYLGAFVYRLVVLFAKTTNTTVKRKSIIIAAVLLIALLCVSFFANGNVISFVRNDMRNTKYISNSYGDSVEKKYTMYNPLEMEYRTYVTFKDGKYLFGDDFDCYISEKDGVMYDGVKEHYIEKELFGLESELSKVTAGAKSGFFVVDSKIMTGIDNVSFEDGIESFKSDVGYVLCYDGLLQEDQKQLFELLCMQALDSIKEEGFDYESIVFCAGNGKEVLFLAKAEKADEPAAMVGAGKDFDEKELNAYGVTEEDILGYWQN